MTQQIAFRVDSLSRHLVSTIILISTLIMSTFSHAKPTVAINKNGITVWKVPVANSKLLGYKAQTVIDAKPHDVLAAVMDIPSASKWLPNTKKAYTIAEDKVYGVPKLYMLVDMPFPLKEREMVMTGQVTGQPGSYKVVNELTTSPHVTPNKKYVQMKKYSGVWEFQQTQDNKTLVTISAHVDPAASLPSWVANMFVTDQPYDLLKNLRKYMKKADYSKTTLDYINAPR